jgi:acyl carrier protein
MIEQKVKTIIANQFGKPIESINTTDNLDDLGADSLDIVEVVMELEDVFKISIEEEEYANRSTVASIVELIENKLAPKV